MLKIIINLIIFFTFINFSFAETVKGVSVNGQYYYGPNLSDNQACEHAKEQAKNNALRKVIPETIVTSTRENCIDVKDKKECSFFEDTWSYLGEGFLQNSKFTSRMVEKDENGKFCKIRLTADILKPNSQSDPSYHLHASLKPSKVFRDKSKDFKIIGEVSKKSYVHILGWYPQEDKNNYHCLTGYFNEYKSPVKKIVFPPSDREVQLEFPLNVKNDFVNQYLIIIAIKENISIPCFKDDKTIKIKKEKLFNFLSSIKRDKWTKEMLIFKVIR